MEGPTDERGDLTPAEAAFVEFLALQDSDHPVAFGDFVGRYPGIAGDLERLHDEWLSVARVLRRGRDDDDRTSERLEELVLDTTGDALQIEFAGELVRRLATTRTPADRYEAQGEIARGGMGVIHRVWDPQLRRHLAMKVILARRDIATPLERARAMHRALARFLEEAQVTSQLDHPGVVPVHDLGIDTRGRVYFTMRLVRGRDFRRILDRVRDGREGWTLARALGVLLKVCEAIAYAHDRGVVHRDLKPANVMVGRFGEVYVMDWGLARVLGRKDAHDLRVVPADGSVLTQVETDVRKFSGQTPGSPLLTVDGRVVGTPAYMSPEQAQGRVEEIGPATDVYALGAMLYHLLAGHMPYVPQGADVSPGNVFTMVLAGPPPRLAKLVPAAPPELVAVCEKAMARDPRDRYEGALAMAADIEAFLDRRPLKVIEPSVGYVARLFLERNRTLAPIVATAVVVLAAVLGLAWRNDRTKRQENQRLLDLRSAQLLTSSRSLASTLEELFPAEPSRVTAMDRWLAEVDEVLTRAPGYRAELAAARAADRRDVVAMLEPAVGDMDWLEQKLRAEIAGWRDRAEGLARATQEDPSWQEAIDEIAACARYGGLELKPQLGLVPLRVDPHSGLWEFWHVLSGERPESDATSPSGYRLKPETGIVLVLVPGGTTTLGSPADEADRDPTNELGVRDVPLEPWFVGKFEVTQAQWRRVLGDEPSLYGNGARILAPNRLPSEGPIVASLNPVESVGFASCERFLHRIGLRLPSEDEWEHAARGGTRSAVWWQEIGGSTLPKGFENVADAACYRQTGQSVFTFDDGQAAHAPVGSFRPNPFGLFDVAGNVGEWCSDWFVSKTPPDDRPRRRIVRGGTWFSPPAFLRSSARQWDNPLAVNSARGLRAARSIQF